MELLAGNAGRCRIIGGGTDLMLEKGIRKQDIMLIDLRRLPGAADIREESGFLVLGHGVTHHQAAVSPLVRRHAEALSAACSRVGGRQIRNVGTVSGNVIAAQPAADAAVALAALGAVCVLAAPGGERQEKPLAAMYAGIGKSSIQRDREILLQIKIPLGQQVGSAYQRLELRRGLALPMVAVAAKTRLEGGAIAEASLAMGPVGVGPGRALEAESYLAGQKPGAEVFAKAGELALQHGDFRDSAVRGSRDYRRKVLPVLVARALAQAVENASQQGVQ